MDSMDFAASPVCTDSFHWFLWSLSANVRILNLGSQIRSRIGILFQSFCLLPCCSLSPRRICFSESWKLFWNALDEIGTNPRFLQAFWGYLGWSCKRHQASGCFWKLWTFVLGVFEGISSVFEAPGDLLGTSSDVFELEATVALKGLGGLLGMSWEAFEAS